MKHTYIISIILSSFFTYKSVAANITSQQYAFFIPGGAFQQNQKVQDIRLMRPRYAKPEKEKQDTTSSQEETPRSSNYVSTPQNRTISASETSISSTSRAQNTLKNRKKSTFPIVQDNIASVQPITTSATDSDISITSDSTNIIFQEETPPAPVSAEVNQKLEQYQLDDNTKITTTQKEEPALPQPQISYLEELKQKSLSALLSDIPYPDSSQPKFKQLYPYYGMELRVYQRRGKFPSNREQEDTLAKANSIKRFEVQ